MIAQNACRKPWKPTLDSQRTRLDYERVLDAYRAVYHGDPASPKADASVFAVAGLLAEEGRLFSDEKLLHDAIGQYEFLRQQYPSSRYRFSALITEGEIYRHDIGDREAAREKFQLFLKTYPQNPLAEQARSELNEIHHATRVRASHCARGTPFYPPPLNRSNRGHAAVVTPPAIQPQRVRPPSRPPPATTPAPPGTARLHAG